MLKTIRVSADIYFTTDCDADEVEHQVEQFMDSLHTEYPYTYRDVEFDYDERFINWEE